MRRTDKLQLIGLGLLIVGFATANSLVDFAASAEGPWRMLGLSGVIVVGLVGLWTIRQPAVAIGLLLAAALVGVFILYFRLDRYAFAHLAPTLLWPLVVWVATWAIVRRVLPRLTRARARVALGLGGLLLFLHLGAAMKAFFPANEFFQLHRVEPIRDLQTLSERVRQPRTGSLDTVLIEARVGGALAEGAVVQAVECLAQSGFGPSPPVRRVAPLVLVLADGGRVPSEGVARRNQTVDWPPTDAPGECGIRVGDLVTVWSDVSPDTQGPLRDGATRILAFGGIEAFRDGYAARAEFAARMFGGVAFLLAFTGVVPLWAGLRRWRALRRG